MSIALLGKPAAQGLPFLLKGRKLNVSASAASVHAYLGWLPVGVVAEIIMCSGAH